MHARIVVRGAVALAVAAFAAAAAGSAGCGTGSESPGGGSGGHAGGGSGGGGGSAAASCGSDNPDDLIADFTMDNGLNPADGRSGGFYVYGDNNGTFDPPKNPDMTVPYPIDMSNGNTACSGAGSFHVKGTGFSMWGAAAGTDFEPRDPNRMIDVDGNTVNAKGTYDASKYKGVSFWAKGAKAVTGVQVKFPDANSDAEADPSVIDSSRSTCVNNTNYPMVNCSPFLVKLGDTADQDFPAYKNSTIGTDWKRFDIMFADAKQDQYNKGQDPNNGIDLPHLTGFAIQVNADYSSGSAKANDFEIWIDDVRFIR